MQKHKNITSYEIGKSANSGESLFLITHYKINEEGNVFLSQELTLQSYMNSASFNLYGSVFTPEVLRDIANKIEEKTIELTKDA